MDMEDPPTPLPTPPPMVGSDTPQEPLSPQWVDTGSPQESVHTPLESTSSEDSYVYVSPSSTRMGSDGSHTPVPSFGDSYIYVSPSSKRIGSDGSQTPVPASPQWVGSEGSHTPMLSSQRTGSDGFHTPSPLEADTVDTNSPSKSGPPPPPPESEDGWGAMRTPTPPADMDLEDGIRTPVMEDPESSRPRPASSSLPPRRNNFAALPGQLQPRDFPRVLEPPRPQYSLFEYSQHAGLAGYQPPTFHEGLRPEPELPIIIYACADCGKKVPLTKHDRVACVWCGQKLLLKTRTNRLVQFEAR